MNYIIDKIINYSLLISDLLFINFSLLMFINWGGGGGKYHILTQCTVSMVLFHCIV